MRSEGYTITIDPIPEEEGGGYLVSLNQLAATLLAQGLAGR